MSWEKALLRRGGAVVPPPWPIGIEPVRGNLIVAMGMPGVGKSLIALNWAVQMRNLPSVVVSLDTDARTQAMRAAGIVGNVPVEQVRQNPAAWSVFLSRRLKHCRMYDIGMTVKDLNDLLISEQQFWGQPPGLLVVDNVSNVVRDTSYESYRNVFIELQKVARMRDCVVLALHHVRRDAARGGALALHAGQYAGEQEAEIVLGLWRQAADSDTLNVGVLKNRNGSADPMGGIYYPLTLDKRTMRMDKGAANGSAGFTTIA